MDLRFGLGQGLRVKVRIEGFDSGFKNSNGYKLGFIFMLAGMVRHCSLQVSSHPRECSWDHTGNRDVSQVAFSNSYWLLL